MVLSQMTKSQIINLNREYFKYYTQFIEIIQDEDSYENRNIDEQVSRYENKIQLNNQQGEY